MKSHPRVFAFAAPCVAAALFAAVVFAAGARDDGKAAATDGGDEEELTIKVPKAVKQGIAREIGEYGEVLDVRRQRGRRDEEWEDGDEGGGGWQASYHVTAQVKEQELEMLFDDNGILIRKWAAGADGDRREVRMQYDELPAPVKTALVDELRGGVAKYVTRHECTTTYITEAEVDGYYYSIRMDGQGNLIDKRLGERREREGDEEGEEE